LTEVTLSEVRDFASLGERWRSLEEKSDLSFFQSWTWIGCLPHERFPDPILAEARDAGETVGLALFNRRRSLSRDTLFLGETGIPNMDRLAVEYNGPVVARDRPGVRDAILRTAAAAYDLVLSGMTEPASGHTVQTRSAPFARSDAGWFSRRSANTRQQIQRSDRACAAFGPLVASRAEDEATPHDWLDAMARMHQATWTARRQPGSFADPFFGRFHHALIRRGMPRKEIDLWRVTAGERLVGILYNFRYRGHVLAYQSGFAYEPAVARLKPGLTCHRMAIEACAEDGVAVYNFLAGDDRYKRSLSDGDDIMQWGIAGPWWSPRLLALRARARAARVRDILGGRS
jgi:CelD/BcsL family acetyltransferase involved in cellulose biosynthesis